MLNTDIFDCIVCGAGPAGLMAAITNAKSRKRVLLLERMKSPGRKLLATGGGRCNLTNNSPLSKFIKAFDGKEKFAKSALKQFTPDSLKQFFENNGLMTHSTNGVQVYPTTEKSIDVVNCLIKIAQNEGVEVQTNVEVNKLIVKDSVIAGLSAGDIFYTSSQVIIASGGKSYPELGSNGSGYQLAKEVGHAIIPPVPALSALKSKEAWPGQCSGLSIDAAIVYVENSPLQSFKKKGSVLFTHKGVSGPAVLDLSKYVSRLLQKELEVKIRIRLLPGISREMWDQFLIQSQQCCGSKSLRMLLYDRIPSRLVNQLLLMAKINFETRAADVKKEEKKRLLELLDSGIPLVITATDDFTNAMVTSGGVDCDEVEAHTMQSKKIKGLYFCGEVLDVDGPCGGYNLQWAFSSGFLAGKAAANFEM